MKRVYVNEKWCLGCHLCEYYCAFANRTDKAALTGGVSDIAKALKGRKIYPRIQVEGDNDISFAISCRHCEEPYCLKSCITGALHLVDGVIVSDKDKCVGCHTCILSCPYGCIMPSEDHGVIQKCDLCLTNSAGVPACVEGCPNQAIVFEDRGVPAYRELAGEENCEV
ncbi:MAG: 4Fe-4S dicluster domain-containing protein [Spirochaetaceae bacterium]|jgi:carbon-monoxide dehydrogenase iron sulfur subunit|nr:4Fe-4S dicluster domain-containing protein [Spirochaetaceae bacterium]